MSVKKLAFVTNDRWVWTHEKPDIELLEPKSLNVTVDKRVLVFANQLERPQQTHKLTITNNGDRPVAFKVMTSDNFTYFVNKTDGIITGRYLNAMPYTCSKNFFELLVSRRPSNYFKTTKYYKKVDVCNNSRKDRLFILIAPVFGCTSSAPTLFNVDSGYEKLRVRLDFAPSMSEKGKSDVILLDK